MPLDSDFGIGAFEVDSNFTDPIARCEEAEGVGKLGNIKDPQRHSSSYLSRVVEIHYLRQKRLPKRVMPLVIVEMAEVKSGEGCVFQELVHFKSASR